MLQDRHQSTITASKSPVTNRTRMTQLHHSLNQTSHLKISMRHRHPNNPQRGQIITLAHNSRLHRTRILPKDRFIVDSSILRVNTRPIRHMTRAPILRMRTIATNSATHHPRSPLHIQIISHSANHSHMQAPQSRQPNQLQRINAIKVRRRLITRLNHPQALNRRLLSHKTVIRKRTIMTINTLRPRHLRQFRSLKLYNYRIHKLNPISLRIMRLPLVLVRIPPTQRQQISNTNRPALIMSHTLTRRHRRLNQLTQHLQIH